VPPSYLSGQPAKLLAVIYDRIGSMHRYGELGEKYKLLFEHLKGRFIQTTLVSSTSHLVALLLKCHFIFEELITYLLITHN